MLTRSERIEIIARIVRALFWIIVLFVEHAKRIAQQTNLQKSKVQSLKFKVPMDCRSACTAYNEINSNALSGF
jgi:hypothetical protein